MRRQARGAAMVEFMVCMMAAIIPLIYYSLFMQDMLLYRLDQQETTTVPAWDFSVLNYQKEGFSSGNIGAVARANRLTYCDHTSAYDSYTRADCSGREAMEHHTSALAAHACWVVTGHNGQVQCWSSRSTGVAQIGSVGAWQSDFGSGGLTSCTAQLGVFNKFLPQLLFQQGVGQGGGGWSKVMLSEKKVFSDANGYSSAIASTHKVSEFDPAVNPGEQIQYTDQYLFQREFFAVLHDPWAVNERAMGAVTPSHFTGRNGLWDRSLSHEGGSSYWNQYRGYTDPVAQYLHNARSVYDITMGLDNFGDNTSTGQMFWSSDPMRSNSLGYSSGWADVRHAAAAGNMSPIYARGMP